MCQDSSCFIVSYNFLSHETAVFFVIFRLESGIVVQCETMNFKYQNIFAWRVDSPIYEQEMKDNTHNLVSNLLYFWTAPL